MFGEQDPVYASWRGDPLLRTVPVLMCHLEQKQQLDLFQLRLDLWTMKLVFSPLH